MRKEDVIREVQSMLHDLHIPGGFQVAKAIVNLASAPADTWKMIGPQRASMKRPMSQAEAARITEAARTRIALVDEGD